MEQTTLPNQSTSVSDHKNRIIKANWTLKEKVYPIYEGVNTIGRNLKAVVNVKDIKVSQNHAILIVNEDRHFISDLGSSNGTYLNNERLIPLKLYEISNESLIELSDIKTSYNKELSTSENKTVSNQTNFSQSSQTLYGESTQILDTFNDTNESNNKENIHEMATQIEILNIKSKNQTNIQFTTNELELVVSGAKNLHEIQTQLGELPPNIHELATQLDTGENFQKLFQLASPGSNDGGTSLDSKSETAEGTRNERKHSPVEAQEANNLMGHESQETIDYNLRKTDDEEQPTEVQEIRADNLIGLESQDDEETQVMDYNLPKLVGSMEGLKKSEEPPDKAQEIDNSIRTESDNVIEESVYDDNNSNSSYDFLKMQKASSQTSSSDDDCSQTDISKMKTKKNVKILDSESDRSGSTSSRNKSIYVLSDDDDDESFIVKVRRRNVRKLSSSDTELSQNCSDSDNETDIEVGKLNDFKSETLDNTDIIPETQFEMKNEGDVYHQDSTLDLALDETVGESQDLGCQKLTSTEDKELEGEDEFLIETQNDQEPPNGCQKSVEGLDHQKTTTKDLKVDVASFVGTQNEIYSASTQILDQENQVDVPPNACQKSVEGAGHEKSITFNKNQPKGADLVFVETQNDQEPPNGCQKSVEGLDHQKTATKDEKESKADDVSFVGTQNEIYSASTQILDQENEVEVPPNACQKILECLDHQKATTTDEKESKVDDVPFVGTQNEIYSASTQILEQENEVIPPSAYQNGLEDESTQTFIVDDAISVREEVLTIEGHAHLEVDEELISEDSIRVPEEVLVSEEVEMIPKDLKSVREEVLATIEDDVCTKIVVEMIPNDSRNVQEEVLAFKKETNREKLTICNESLMENEINKQKADLASQNFTDCLDKSASEDEDSCGHVENEMETIFASQNLFKNPSEFDISIVKTIKRNKNRGKAKVLKEENLLLTQDVLENLEDKSNEDNPEKIIEEMFAKDVREENKEEEEEVMPLLTQDIVENLEDKIEEKLNPEKQLENIFQLPTTTTTRNKKKSNKNEETETEEEEDILLTQDVVRNLESSPKKSELIEDKLTKLFKQKRKKIDNVVNITETNNSKEMLLTQDLIENLEEDNNLTNGKNRDKNLSQTISKEIVKKNNKLLQNEQIRSVEEQSFALIEEKSIRTRKTKRPLIMNDEEIKVIVPKRTRNNNNNTEIIEFVDNKRNTRNNKNEIKIVASTCIQNLRSGGRRLSANSRNESKLKNTSSTVTTTTTTRNNSKNKKQVEPIIVLDSKPKTRANTKLNNTNNVDKTVTKRKTKQDSSGEKGLQQNLINPSTSTSRKRCNSRSSSSSLDSSVSLPKNLKKSVNNLLATPERSRRLLKPKVVFTMMDDPELESLIRQLGGCVVDSVDASTVLVTNCVKRSEKLLIAVGQGKPICSPKWIEDSKKSNTFLDPWDYILIDKEAEKKWNFSLRESLRRSTNRKLMENYTFQFLTNDKLPVLKSAIEACGGTYITRALNKTSTTNKHFVIISTNNEKTKFRKIVKQNPEIQVVEPEAIFDGTLRQELRLENHLIL